MKKLFYRLLSNIDTFIVRSLGWKHIPNSTNKFMYLVPCTYKGSTITLKDGTVISKGDIIAELHIDNSNIRYLNTSYPNLIKLLKGELIALNKTLKEDSTLNIKAIFGISVFSDIAERQGFTIIDIESKFKRFFISLGENILRLGLKNGNKKTRKKFLFSKECWLSRKQIVNLL